MDFTDNHTKSNINKVKNLPTLDLHQVNSWALFSRCDYPETLSL